jgi:hypothetical protein
MINKARELLLGALAAVCLIAAFGGIFWWLTGPLAWKGLVVSASGILGMYVLGSATRKPPSPPSERSADKDHAT